MVHLSSHGTLNLPRMENIEQGKLKDIFRYISHQMLFCNVFSQLEKIDDAYRKNNWLSLLFKPCIKVQVMREH